MSRIEKQTLRRSKRIQQKKRGETKQKNNKKRKLEENTKYFNQAFQLSDGRVHIARIKQVTVRGVPVEASAATSAEPEKNHSVLSNRSNRKSIQGSRVSKNKKKRLSKKPRKRPNKKGTPVRSSSKTKTPLLNLSDKVIDIPNEDMARSCSSFQLSGELPAANTITLLGCNSSNHCSHKQFVSIPNSQIELNQLSNGNNIADATEEHASTLRQQGLLGHCCGIDHSQQQELNQICEHNIHTIPNCQLVNTGQNQTMPQVLNIDRNCTPGPVPHNTTFTQEPATVLQTNQMQNNVSRQLFTSRPNASSIPNPSKHPRGGINVGGCSQHRMIFQSQKTSHPVCSNGHNRCHIIHHINHPLLNKDPAVLANLPNSQHLHQANTVQHFVHYVYPPLPYSLAGSVDHHSFYNQQSGINNILPSGISAQGTATQKVFNYHKHASQLTEQQFSNSRGQTQEHTIYLPFYGNTPVEIEIK